jgi:glutamine amidotransferase
MIAVVDSGVANLASVLAALSRLGCSAEVTTNPGIIRSADRIIVPGVGAAASAMEQLQKNGLVDALRVVKQPVLGICLGMQLLFARSDEGEGIDCLGVIPGRIRALKALAACPIPHMGWNEIRVDNSGHPLLKDIADGSYMYFAHSFAAPEGRHTLALAEHGGFFPAVVAHGNYFGCQFHPERSGASGLKLIENFLSL